MSETRNYLFAAALGVVAVLLVAVVFSIAVPEEKGNSAVGKVQFAAADSASSSADCEQEQRTLSVSSTVEKMVSPDEVDITLSVETLATLASKSQSDNAAISTKVRDALKALGIADKDIKTVSYSVRDEYEWNDISKKSEFKGYRTTNSIQITLKDLTMAGKAIDAAVQAGANKVSQVVFALSTAKQAEIKLLALKEAAAEAKLKAVTMAEGLGVSVGQLMSANENTYYYTPNYSNVMYNAKVAGDSAMAETPISAGDVSVTASVSAVFEIQ
ncbi:MAG: SIMPL domain-containing protein [Candidatus Diapherotrites archaeon]|nr:SIMPL domain-containing protein [Candidatus Diapherotrites archaeon]